MTGRESTPGESADDAVDRAVQGESRLRDAMSSIAGTVGSRNAADGAVYARVDALENGAEEEEAAFLVEASGDGRDASPTMAKQRPPTRAFAAAMD